jgi:integrase
LSKKPSPKAERVVRKTLADGTVKEYRYGAWEPKRQPSARIKADTIDALLAAFRRSPEFKKRAEATRRQYAIYLRAWDEMGHLRAADVSRRIVLMMRDGIAEARGHGAATAFVRVSSTLFSWAVDHEWREHSPTFKVKTLPGGHITAWIEAQADDAEARLPDYLARVVVLARYTGQRRSDLCALTWSDYDGRSIRLRQMKTGALLVIPCHPRLKAALDRWKAEGRAAVNILLNGWGRPWVPEVLSSAMKRRLEEIGMPGLNVHGLRKMAAAGLAEAGCTPHEIQAITGHATLAMVELYTKSVDQERLAGQAIARLLIDNRPVKR